ncbi:hypothetical protein ACIGXG_03585 [Streptomyces goshikiensis]
MGKMVVNAGKLENLIFHLTTVSTGWVRGEKPLKQPMDKLMDE